MIVNRNYKLKISRRIGLRPLKKNSTAITMTINPMIRIMTLIPVCPRNLISLFELSRMM